MIVPLCSIGFIDIKNIDGEQDPGNVFRAINDQKHCFFGDHFVLTFGGIFFLIDHMCSVGFI